MLTQEIQIKLTAFALGETDYFTPEELDEIKSLLMADAEARAFVQEVKETAAGLSAEFALEKSPGLTSDQKTTIGKAAVKRNPFKLSRYLLPLSAVAACAIAAFVFMDWEKHSTMSNQSLSRDYSGRAEKAWDSSLADGADAKSQAVPAPLLSRPMPVTPEPQYKRSLSQDWGGHAPSEIRLGKEAGAVSKISKDELAVPGQPASPEGLYGWAVSKGKEQTSNSGEDTGLLPDSVTRQRVDAIADQKKEIGNQGGKEVNEAGKAAISKDKGDADKDERFQSRSAVIAEHSALNIEATTPYTALLTYPPDWDTLTTRERFNTAPNSVSKQAEVSDMRRRTEAKLASEKDPVQRAELIDRLAEIKAIQLQLGEEVSAKPHSQDAFDAITENAFLKALGNPLSTFSIDVDTASYSIVRNLINSGRRPPRGAVRIEEFINYFPYEYSQPVDGKPFAVHTETHPAPWNQNHLLVKVGLKGKEIALEKLPPANLVFLIDVSGSMNAANKLPYVKESLKMLVTQLREQDQVAMVVYAGSSGLVLPSTSGKDKATIMNALDKLSAGGSTNGGQGIALAYKVASESFVKGGSNRVILMSDGDFNVGVTSRSDLNDLIVKNAKSGVYLSIFGFGMGNLKDSTLEELSRKGNGNYGYIDDLPEAQKSLVQQMAGTLHTIAKDVKIQVEFNPNAVKSYRLIGYENRIMAKEDFNNDLKDAGDIGAGHTVTALYEVVPAWLPDPAPAPQGAEKLQEEIKQLRRQISEMQHTLTVAKMTEEALKNHVAQIQVLENKLVELQGQAQQLAEAPKAPAKTATPEVDPLKYQVAPEPAAQPKGDAREMLTLKLRYKAPDAPDEQGTSKLIEVPVKMVDTRLRIARPRPSADFNFAAAVAEYGMILRQSQYAGNASLIQVLDLAENGMGNDIGGHRAEFIKLVRKTQPLMPETR